MKKAVLFTCMASIGSVVANDSAALTTYPTLQNSNQMRVSADALLWRTEQGGTEWAIEEDFLAQVTSYKDINFGWNWGFRVAVGLDVDRDEWDTNLSYTWFHAHQNSKVSGEDNVTSIPTTSLFDSGGIKWHIDYSGLDWDLGGNYMVRTHLAMRPHVGLKFGWINQNIHAAYRSSINDVREEDTFLKSKFFGVGPSSGVTSKWNFAKGFNLFGDLSGALMWGNFKISEYADETDEDGLTTRSNYKNLSRNYVVPVLSTVLGLGWTTNFNNEASRFTVNLGYELQYWFRQSQFMNVNTDTRLGQDLAFQGGTLELRFDF